jgi:Lrp/AsnC family transcriptional regulator, leucine-responsive regulatory protein
MAGLGDELDEKILDVLRADGRAPLAEIGQAVGLSAPAVKRRIDRMESEGVITGYTVRVDIAKLGHTLEAFTEIRFAGATAVEDIADLGQGMPEVKAVHTIAGDPDALVHLQVRDVGHLTETINKLRKSGRVTGTKTLMVLGTRRGDGA